MASTWPMQPGRWATFVSCTSAGSARSAAICGSLAYTRAGTPMPPVRGISHSTSPRRWISMPSDVQDHACAPRVTCRLDGEVVPRDRFHLAVQVMALGIEALPSHDRRHLPVADVTHLDAGHQEAVDLR